MVYLTLHTNRTFTAEFFPYFEIIYVVELFFILIFYALAPVAFYVLWNARPFHRNLRLSMCNLVIQGLLGTTSRVIFLYNQYFGDGPLEQRTSVIIASMLRVAMHEAFGGLFFFFALERLIATFAWSWYEKTSPLTIIVFLVLEGCALLWSWAWAIGLTFEYMIPKDQLISFVCPLIVGGPIGLFVIAANYRESMKIKVGARINQYSVARTFQIRENIAILKALSKMGVGVIVLNVPLFVLGAVQMFGHTFVERMFAGAFFDLIISMQVLRSLNELQNNGSRKMDSSSKRAKHSSCPTTLITMIPLSDSIFERSLRKMSFGERLFGAVSILVCRGQKKSKVVVNETDHYFSMLQASLNGPPSK